MQLSTGTLLQGGKYLVTRVLGQGGFGITYEAEQVNLSRKVAIKEFFMKDYCERNMETSHVTVGTGAQRDLVEKFRGKFVREAKMIASFEHPNIVRIIDVFEENNTAYYVMENLPGGSLVDKIKKEGCLSEKQAEKYIRQVADALEYIHKQGTVHLDVKPSNILLNGKGDAVLIDFGISKHYDKSGEQTSSTPVGLSKGYAPLEQGRDGDASQFTPATDIYALGATLYYLITGQVPPEASIVLTDGLVQPSGVSNLVWQVVERSMQPRYKDRPQSIEEFLRLLDSLSAPNNQDDESTVVHLNKEPKQPATPETKPQATRMKKNWPWIVAAFLVLAVIFGLVLVKKHRTQKPNKIATDTTMAVAAPTSVEADITFDPLRERNILDSLENSSSNPLLKPSKLGGLAINGDYPNYSIVIGAYRSGEYANRRLEQCKDSLVPASIIAFKNGLSLVTAFHSDYLEPTLEILNKKRGKGLVPNDAQILVINSEDEINLRNAQNVVSNTPSEESPSVKSTIQVKVDKKVEQAERFNVIFFVDGNCEMSNFQWSPGTDFTVVWGPQKGVSTSSPIKSTITYILQVNKTGTFKLPSATYTVNGSIIKSSPVSINVVNNNRQFSSDEGQVGSDTQPSNSSNSNVVDTENNRGFVNGHEWVDLGLSVKWATNNVGAYSMADYGGYYAWGEVDTKDTYSWQSYRYRISGDFNQYSSSGENTLVLSKYNGRTDNKVILDKSDDVAQRNWGEGWRMPSKSEFDELISNCNYSFKSIDGVNGFVFISRRNHQTVFLPCSGYRDGPSLKNKDGCVEYWSSSLTSGTITAFYLSVSSSRAETTPGLRYEGMAIRPVIK